VPAAASCQLLSFLALAAREGIDVLHYEDGARGLMSDTAAAHGLPMRIERIDPEPRITVAPGCTDDRVLALVERAHDTCCIANSLVSTITVKAIVTNCGVTDLGVRGAVHEARP
jgi:organic hydroperoxide reductase OsmC/OhrA